MCDSVYVVPLVETPIQFKYLVSFLEMQVFPRAGSPTITIMVGELVNWGTEAATKTDEDWELSLYFWPWDGLVPCTGALGTILTNNNNDKKKKNTE